MNVQDAIDASIREIGRTYGDLCLTATRCRLGKNLLQYWIATLRQEAARLEKLEKEITVSEESTKTKRPKAKHLR